MKVSDFVQKIAQNIGMGIGNGAGLPTSSEREILAQFSAELLRHIAEKERVAAANPHGHRQKLDTSTSSWISYLREFKFKVVNVDKSFKIEGTLRDRESELQLEALERLLRPAGLSPTREYLMRDGPSSKVSLFSRGWACPGVCSQEEATDAARRANELIGKAVAAYDQKIYNVWPGDLYLWGGPSG